MLIKPHPFTLPFVKKESVAHDTFAFYFDRVKRGSGSPENWDFHPGQYIQMRIPKEDADDRGTMRYFTISSSPLDRQYLRVITKVIQSSFKKTLDSLQQGQEVSFFGPNGAFYLKEEESSHVFLAGGVGMTPFISMIEYAAAKNVQNQLTLLVSFSTPQDFIFFDELSQISKEHQNIHVVYTTERISPELMTKHIPSVTKPLYYITGPPPMVDAMVKMVGEMGISEDRILQEHFSGY